MPLRSYFMDTLETVMSIPEKYIHLLCYDDPSGLTDSEIYRLYHWMNTNRLQFNCIISDYPYYTECADIDNEPSEAYDVSFIIRQ